MGSYTAENSPPLSCYPIPPLDADGQLITLVGHRGVGGGAVGRDRKKKKIRTILKKIRADLRKVKPEFLAARLFHKQAKAGAIICEGRRELLAPVRFDFSGRNWISSH